MSSPIGNDEIQEAWIYKLQSIFRPREYVPVISSEQSQLTKSRLSKELGCNCQDIERKAERLSLDSPPVKHYKVNFPDDLSKIQTTIYRILEFAWYVVQVVIFVPTREVAELLHAAVIEHSHAVQILHAALTEKDRDLIVGRFNGTFIQVLITTDAFLPPEFDQSLVHVVINWEMPRVCDSLEEEEPDVAVYSQRLCSKGAVFNFLCGERDNMVMKKVESRLNSKVSELCSWTDFEVAMEEAGCFEVFY